MKAGDFVLDPRLDRDTLAVGRLELCELRLMDDARFGWLILVPQRVGVSEVHDLPAAEQARLWHEVGLAATALRATMPCDKLNLGALGNIVRQLHVHVVARREDDAAWPGPVWGSGPAVHYDGPAAGELIERLHAALPQRSR